PARGPAASAARSPRPTPGNCAAATVSWPTRAAASKSTPPGGHCSARTAWSPPSNVSAPPARPSGRWCATSPTRSCGNEAGSPVTTPPSSSSSGAAPPPAIPRGGAAELFDSLPSGLLTAIHADGRRVDLLTVPDATPRDEAEASMELASHPRNVRRIPDLLLAVLGAFEVDLPEAGPLDAEQHRPFAAEDETDLRRLPRPRVQIAVGAVDVDLPVPGGPEARLPVGVDAGRHARVADALEGDTELSRADSFRLGAVA